MDTTFSWQPQSNTRRSLEELALKTGRHPQELIDEAVSIYLEQQKVTSEYHPESDPLIGLFTGSPNLSTDAEVILGRDINSVSGWTWKKFYFHRLY
jgi:hypothetical protein